MTNSIPRCAKRNAFTSEYAFWETNIKYAFEKACWKSGEGTNNSQKKKVSEFSLEGKTESSVCLAYQKDDEEMNCSHYISNLMGRQ